MRIKIFGIGLACFFLISCMELPQPKIIVNSFTIEKPFDSVWQAVIETFAELNLPILNIEKDSGLITTDWIDFIRKENMDYFDCGKLGMNIEKSRSGRFNVFVKRLGDNSCEIKINCTYQQEYYFPDLLGTGKEYTDTRQCISTGKLEAEMFRLIEEKASSL